MNAESSMDHETKNGPQSADSTARSIGKAYSAPQLRSLGRVNVVTQGSGTATDDASKRKPAHG
jgi:hypothetical protein